MSVIVKGYSDGNALEVVHVILMLKYCRPLMRGMFDDRKPAKEKFIHICRIVKSLNNDGISDDAIISDIYRRVRDDKFYGTMSKERIKRVLIESKKYIGDAVVSEL